MKIRYTTAILLAAFVLAACSGGSDETAPPPERGSLPASAFPTDRCDEMRELAQISRRGLYEDRSPEVIPIPAEPNFIGGETTLVHSGPWDYLTHVPWVIYGPGHLAAVGDVGSPTTMADLAPTTAKLIGFDGYRAPDGKARTQGLTQSDVPRLVITVVWDGGGYNVLNTYPRSWPFVSKLMREGVSYTDFSIGSNPSVTPSIHTTLGTGAFPRNHGVVGLKMRTQQGTYVNPVGGSNPARIMVPSLSDLYDRARDNKPKTGMLGSVSWHIGMVGHGAAFRGGDKDPVALLEHERPVVKTNQTFYSLPDIDAPGKLGRLIHETDLEDGERDGKWFGRSLETQKDLSKTPVAVRYNRVLLERMIERERFGADNIPDLLYVNFKSMDLAGHAYSFLSKDMPRLLEAEDSALRQLKRFLDERVGKERWVMMLTADHGQTPFPRDSGAWPIRGGELAADLNRRFDPSADGVNLIDRVGASGIYVNTEQLEDVTLNEIARWVGDYRLVENLKDSEQVPEYYQGKRDDRIFDAVLVRGKLVVPNCEG
jgi:hypothetical protein